MTIENIYICRMDNLVDNKLLCIIPHLDNYILFIFHII